MKTILRSSRIISVDIIRVLAMLLVVVLHTVLSFTLRPDFFGTKVWWIFEPIVAFSKTSVLLFFMVSGYLVISKNRTVKENLRKIIKTIVIPFSFFTALDLLLQRSILIHQGGYLPLNFGIERLERFVTFPNSALWFLVVLFFLYVLHPIRQLLFASEKHAYLARYITQLAFLVFILAALFKFPGAPIDPFGSILTGWLGFVGFYLYGGLVRNGWIKIHSRKINLVLALCGFTVTILGDYFSSSYVTALSSLPIAVTAIASFNLLISTDYNFLQKSEWGKKIGQIIL